MICYLGRRLDSANDQMTSSTSSAAAAAVGVACVKRQPCETSLTDANCPIRSLSLDQVQGQSQGQNDCQGQANGHDLVRTQGLIKKAVLTSVVTSDIGVASSSSMKSSCSWEKPQKPVKPKHLRTLIRSRVEAGSDVTSGSGSRSRGSSEVPVSSAECVSPPPPPPPSSSSSSQYTRHNAALQHSSNALEATARQACPRSAYEQKTPWTRTSQFVVPSQPSSVSDTSAVCDGQNSPQSRDKELTQWTAPSIVKSFPFQHSDIAVETTCRQDSPRCNDDQPVQGTVTSRRVQDDADDNEAPEYISSSRSRWAADRIEPPVISDLEPDNVHIRRGETLHLTALFSAYPTADVSWYRSSDLLTAGQHLQ